MPANSDTTQLKQAYDLIRQQVPSVVVCAGTSSNNGMSVVIGVSGDLLEKGINVDKIIKKEINPLINGNGGGSPQLAQAVGKDPSKLSPAIEKAKEILKKALLK